MRQAWGWSRLGVRQEARPEGAPFLCYCLPVSAISPPYSSEMHPDTVPSPHPASGPYHPSPLPSLPRWSPRPPLPPLQTEASGTFPEAICDNLRFCPFPVLPSFLNLLGRGPGVLWPRGPRTSCSCCRGHPPSGKPLTSPRQGDALLSVPAGRARPLFCGTWSPIV